MQRHGTVYEERDGRLVRIFDRNGWMWAGFEWAGASLARLIVPGMTVDGAIIRDDLLGDAHAIRRDAAAPATAMSAIDWARPTEIPTIAAPGSLPPGAGGALLNAIAVLAARAQVPALRYGGPYPTPALWRALSRCFTTQASEEAFTNDLIDRASRLARDPIAVDFAPAPCERISIPRGFVELRSRLERAVIDGVAYEPDGSPTRLIEDRAEVWFGDAPYARVATFAPDGALLDGPHAIPLCTSVVVGKQFPPALSHALAELVAEAVAAPLAADARAWVASRPMSWADLGARAARSTSDGLAVHAALWDRIGPLGLGRLALALAEALVPVVTAAIVTEVVQP